jgi:hypothetical protein
MVLGAAKLIEKYVESYLDKNPQRVAEMSDMGWVLFVLKTPGEWHTQLHMNIEIFMDLRDLLVSRYGLQPSMHMNTYMRLLQFSCLYVLENESSRRTQNRFNHSSETISRKFSEVSECMMAMAKDFSVPKDANFSTIQKRTRDDKKG